MNIKDILRRLKARLTRDVDFDTISDKQKTAREGNLNQLRQITKDYLEKHPNFKVPREFRGLIK